MATQQVNELLTAPDAKVYATTMNGAPVSFVVSKARDQALFLGDDIPSPGDGKAYQLWVVDAAGATSVGVLADDAGTVRQLTDDFSTGDALAITLEPATGSTQPTTDPLVVLTAT